MKKPQYKYRKQWSRVIGCGLAGMFLFCSGRKLVQASHADIFLTGEYTEGVVECTESRRLHCNPRGSVHPDRNIADYATISYTTRDGQSLRATSPIAHAASYKPGKAVRVCYRAGHPTIIRVLEFSAFFPLLLPLSGTVLLGISGISLLLHLRARSEK